ncbi:MAG: alanine dehydrogenase, partial [Actinobacteria bacterium]|nr:alanine dehydrogenase [Actinomycetota bacterium]
YALTNATLPYQLEIASIGARGAAMKSDAIRLGVNTANGHVCNEPVARDLGKDYVEALTALG